MRNPEIKYYPVGNGDQSLITLTDGTTIIVDCNIRQASIGSKDSKVYDVKKDLLKSIGKREGNPYVDVFILTHGDCDHCRGFEGNFYQGDPKKYSNEDKKADKIIIDEMWFSPMIAEEHTNDDEDAYQQEAERRLELHRKKHADKDLAGNRIKIIGYDANKDYQDLNHLRATPGSIVTKFNSKEQNKFSVFIHSPFKEHLESAEKDKNSTSIVFQARFKGAATDSRFSCLAMFGGDSDHYSWDIILQKTKKYGNDSKEKALDWDLFLAPHHCSWSFFNNRPYSENSDPKDHSKEVLKYKRSANAKVISSSKKILDDDDNPPHYPAKQQYIASLGNASNFLNTAIDPKESGPEPIIFDITPNGPARPPKINNGGAIGSAGGAGAASTVIKQG
ncbi:cobyric acid synthase CobQ [Rufibacter sp. LB8]|uniref:cobyric acid synthase CobQ n=1 Tax=Rufibacter sp. LB8 TaxID=2777781 RepID=UPI00178C53CE|nr:cobyric acid synthase CobQ [Rufibacter sp. LB8]